MIEASRLRELCRSDDIALSEHMCRPLVQSTALWLINMGVTHEAYHPGVFDKVGSLLHKELPATMLQLKGSAASSKKPGSAGQNLFSRRIQDYMKNTIRKGDWQLQVPSNAELRTPLRALKAAGKVRECNSPVQGHSGKSIIGRGRSADVEPQNKNDVSGLEVTDVGPPAISPVPAHNLTPPPADTTRDSQEVTSSKEYDERVRNLMSELEEMRKSTRARDVDVAYSSRAVSSSTAPISGNAQSAHQTGKRVMSHRADVVCGSSVQMHAGVRCADRAFHSSLPPCTDRSRSKPNKRRAIVDSSEDDEAADASHKPVQPSTPSPHPSSDAHGKQAAKRSRQTTLAPKLKSKQVLIEDTLDLTAKGPPLTVQNAVTRFVFVPASVYGVHDTSVKGYIGQIKKVDKASRVSIKFHDKTDYFAFDYVRNTFTPLV